MKLFKPNHSYGTNQKSFSNYEYEEQKSQFNYTNYQTDNKSNYNIQAPECILGQSIGGFDANGASQSRSSKSTNFYANAQRAYPSPSLYVQQGHHDHVMEKMNMKESHMGQEWAGNSPKCPNPAPLDNSSHTMHNEKHMMGEMGHGSAKNPNQFSSPAQTNNYSQSMYKGGEEEAYGYGEDVTKGGYGNTNNLISTPNYLSPIKTKQSMNNNSWGNSSSDFSSPTQAQHSGLKMHNKEHMAGNTNISWGNSPTKFSSSTQAQQSHLSKEHMLENNDLDLGYLSNNFSNTTQARAQAHGLSNSTPKFHHSSSNSTQARHSNMATHEGGHMMGAMDHGWASSPTKFSTPAKTHHSSLAMENDEEYMMGKTEHGWSNGKSNCPSQAPNMSMHKGGHMMGEMDHGLGYSPTKYSSPVQTQHSGLTMQKEAHMMGKSSQGWANSPTHYSGPNHFSSSNSTMSRGLNQQEWGGNSSNQFGASHINSRSAQASYDDSDQYVDEDVHEIMDEILTKYPAHNVSGGHGSSRAISQHGFGGSAHYGSARSNLNAGYMSNCKKEEYSSSSSAKTFESKSMINKGGFYI